MILMQVLLTGIFRSEWEKGNIVPIHNKSNKQYTKNYHPVPLLPICGEIFQKSILNEMYNYFSANKFISKNQTGSQPDDSCISLLL